MITSEAVLVAARHPTTSIHRFGCFQQSRSVDEDHRFRDRNSSGVLGPARCTLRRETLPIHCDTCSNDNGTIDRPRFLQLALFGQDTPPLSETITLGSSLNVCATGPARPVLSLTSVPHSLNNETDGYKKRQRVPMAVPSSSSSSAVLLTIGSLPRILCEDGPRRTSRRHLA